MAGLGFPPLGNALPLGGTPEPQPGLRGPNANAPVVVTKGRQPSLPGGGRAGHGASRRRPRRPRRPPSGRGRRAAQVPRNQSRSPKKQKHQRMSPPKSGPPRPAPARGPARSHHPSGPAVGGPAPSSPAPQAAAVAPAPARLLGGCSPSSSSRAYTESPKRRRPPPPDLNPSAASSTLPRPGVRRGFRFRGGTEGDGEKGTELTLIQEGAAGRPGSTRPDPEGGAGCAGPCSRSARAGAGGRRPSTG